MAVPCRRTIRPGGPILTMDRRPSAVLRRVFAGHFGPSGAKLCAHFAGSREQD
jgi:hypothetical protein